MANWFEVRAGTMRISWLPDLFDLQGARWQRPQQIVLIAGLLQPCRPIGAFQHNHLPIMDRRDIWARVGRQLALTHGCAACA